MSEFIGVVTLAGQAKIAGAVGGTALNITTIRVGDGNGAPIVPLETMTDLVRRVGTAYAVTASGRDPANANIWRFTTVIDEEEGPFDIREIGLFDAEGTMIAIAKHPFVEKRSTAQGAAVALTTDIIVPISETAQVSVALSSEVAVDLARMLRAPFIAVNSATLANPPVGPAIGDTYVIAEAATGVWTGFSGRFAQWTGSVWTVKEAALGTVVCDQSRALDHASRFLRRTAEGWVSAAASEVAYGVARLATAAEAADAANAAQVLTPARLPPAIAGYLRATGGSPIYPEILTSNARLAITAAAGVVTVDAGQAWIHRGLTRYSSDQFTAGTGDARPRAFAHVANKVYHLVWDAPGTGLATPLANWPDGRFSLIDRTGASPAENDPSYDTTYDRMLIARITTGGANGATIEALTNRAVLAATVSKTSMQTDPSSWGNMSGLVAIINWSRAPQAALRLFNTDATTGNDAVTGISNSGNRYNVASYVSGYVLSGGQAGHYISGAVTLELRA